MRASFGTVSLKRQSVRKTCEACGGKPPFIADVRTPLKVLVKQAEADGFIVTTTKNSKGKLDSMTLKCCEEYVG